jgi:hypothetical protein
MVINHMLRLVASSVLLVVFLITGHVAYAQTFQLKREGGVLTLPVQINHSITLNFTIDSGASDVVIPEDVFSTLSRTGTITSTDMLASGTYELADGTRHQARRFRIRSLVMGGLELKDVTASIEPAGGTLLLGQSFLSKLPGWSIDNKRELLVVGDAIKNDGEGPPPAETPQQIQEHIQRIQEHRERVTKWLACNKPFEERTKAVLDIYHQISLLYPRFGLLWTESINSGRHCSKVMRDRADGGAVTEADAALCDLDALKQADADFVNRVASTAEPAAVQIFNMGRIAVRLAQSESDQTCGEL